MLVILVLALSLAVCSAKAEPMGTAFTYQGRLIDANEAAEGLYDFQFTLYDDPNAGTQQGDTIYIDNNDVNDGYFTVKLDFGSDVFTGDARWLDIGVRPGEQSDPCEYTTLEPRQEVTATPYALQTRGIFVDSNDNIGIGTTSPSQKLEVNGNINVTGGQIIFPATQSASANVNTLDDYEEGTWSPGIAFGGGTTGILYANRGGNYTKIGNVVIVSGNFLLLSKGSSTGAATVTGLPFTVLDDPPNATGAVALFLESITFANQFQGTPNGGGTTISLKELTEAGGISNLTDADFVDTSRVRLSVTYRVE